MINVEKLHNELRHITIFPEQWDQASWVRNFDGVATQDPNVAENTACGTYGCLAGNALLHSKVPVKWTFEPLERTGEYYKGTLTDAEKETLKGRWYFEGTEDGRHVSDAAAELFGFTSYQADMFFNGENDLDTLWELAEKVTLGEISDYDYTAAKREAKQQAFLDAEKKLNALEADSWDAIKVYEDYKQKREAFEAVRYIL